MKKNKKTYKVNFLFVREAHNILRLIPYCSISDYIIAYDEEHNKKR